VDVPFGGAVTLGRSDEADIVIDDPELSRLHARLAFEGAPEVTDLDSSNGTIVRGHPIAAGTPCVLLSGESFEIGTTTVVVEAAAGAGLTAAGSMAAADMEAVNRVADRVAASSISVLLLGETGVGKGVMARRIHEHSARRDARFLELNCAALPEQLLESELLGHEKGAFTGATTSRPGLLEVADGGTVFLDEAGELPPAIQAKLLRVIEERQVMRIGGRQSRTTDVRFVAATNRDLSVEVAQGRFRSDLYYRLNGITLYIPPLRERRDEVLPLAQQFLASAEVQRDARAAPRLSEEVAAYLLQHPWPGNIRELRNLIQRAVVLCEGDEIRVEHLFVTTARPASAPMAPVEAGGIAVPVRPPPAAASPPPAAATDDSERGRIVEALERFGGNQTKAARHLGMSRTTLSARLDTYGIARPKKPG
jgi:transcriptional regulator with GAF, ATPase, and Fis domain